MRILIYSSAARGCGQFVRSFKFAQIVTANFPGCHVVVAVGNGYAPRAVPKRTEVLFLPMVWKMITGELVAREGSVQHAMSSRAAMLEDVIDRFVPDLFFVDTRPTGLEGELREILWRLRRNSSCRLTLVLRDIVDSPARVMKDWTARGYFHILRHLYDHILVLGERDYFDAVRAYGLQDFATKVHYLGFVGSCARPSAPSHSGPIRGRTLVTVGGGFDGVPVIQSVLAQTQPSADRRSYYVVLGPKSPLDAAQIQSSLGSDCTVLSLVPSLQPLIDEADVVVTMCGYNTIFELIEARKRVVVIPRSGPGEEQILRARRLTAYYDRIWVVPMERVGTPALGDAIDQAHSAAASTSVFPLRAERNLVRFIRSVFRA